MKNKSKRMLFGKIGEYYAQILFMRNEYDVYMPLVDNKGIDFIAKKCEKEYKVQVKTVCPYSYCYIRENENSEFDINNENFLVCYIRLNNILEERGQLPTPEIYIFTATLWKELNEQEELKDFLADYSQSSNPEYGIKYNKIKGIESIKKYLANDFFIKNNK